MSQGKEIALIGYSGHAFVAADIFASANKQVSAYCDFSEKGFNPYNLKYLGREQDEKTIEKMEPGLEIETDPETQPGLERFMAGD